jgi:hypothetical protein
MKKTIYCIILIICTVNCKGQNKEKDNLIMNDTMKNNMYTIYIHSQCPYDLYINDIPAVINEGGNSSSSYDINDYVLHNGKYKIKAVFYTNPEENTLINHTKLILYSSLKNKGEKLGNLKELQNLPVPNLVSTKPTKIVQEWEVELTDLPYKLEGWENSRVFKKEDSLLVKEKVVAFYEKARKILNEGKSEEYIKLLEKRNAEFKIFDFEIDENIMKGNNSMKDRIIKYASGNMLPLEDYVLKIYGQGRLVRLERIGNVKIKTSNNSYRTIKEINEGTNSEKHLETRGWSPLILNSSKAVRRYSFYLHMPQDSNEFEIIR